MTLLREVEVYLRNTGVAPTRLGIEALGDRKVVRDLKNGAQFGPLRANKLRAWMKAHPRGLPAASRKASAAAILADTASEAACAGVRRRQARSTGTVVRTIERPPLTLAERIATMLVEQPGDLVATVKRQWPDLWDRVIAAARIARVSPGAQLMTVIEAGLSAAAGEADR